MPDENDWVGQLSQRPPVSAVQRAVHVQPAIKHASLERLVPYKTRDLFDAHAGRTGKSRSDILLGMHCNRWYPFPFFVSQFYSGFCVLVTEMANHSYISRAPTTDLPAGYSHPSQVPSAVNRPGTTGHSSDVFSLKEMEAVRSKLSRVLLML